MASTPEITHHPLVEPSPELWARPRVISMGDYQDFWKPRGWNLIIIGPTSTWRQEWGDWEAIRDIVQNSLDEAEGYRWGYDETGFWISDSGKGIAVADFLLGPPKLKPDYARGKFGEGMKISALALLRQGYSVHVETVDREVWIIFLEQKVNGTAETLAALWRPDGRPQGTEFHIIGYKGSAFEDRFAVNVPPKAVLASAPAHLIGPIPRYNQLIDHPFPAGSRIFARDIYMREINSIYSYNLWGFDMAPDRFGPKEEAELWADMGRLWSCVTDTHLLEIFLQMVQEPPILDTEETRRIDMSRWGMGFEPASNRAYVEFVKDNADAWRTAWQEQLGPNSVIRTDARWDSMVKHLGYNSIGLQWGVTHCLRQVITTDDELVAASQDKLRDVDTIADENLSPRQRACLELAREIARRITGWMSNPVMGVHAAMIPPASDRVRTSGMYVRPTQEVFLSADQLEHGRSTVDTVIHEIAHHTSGAEDGEEGHNQEMTKIAGQVVERTANGVFNDCLKLEGFRW